MRKIVQIAPNPKNGTSTVLALCDDGTVWGLGRHAGDDHAAFWGRLTPIPQDQPPAKEAE